MTTLSIPRLSQFQQRMVLLTMILLLGGLLRIHTVAERSLWADEGWTMVLSAGPGLDDVIHTLADDQHPPLFFVIFRLWRTLTGDTEFTTRYFSILIGLVAVAGVHQLGRELFGETVGLLAALLLALADNHIDLSQEVRHYGLLMLWVVLSSLFYVRWWHRPSQINRIAYVFTSVSLLYTHYLGGYVLIAQALHMLLVVRPSKRLLEALFLFGVTCLGFLPWLPVVAEQNRARWGNPLYYQNALPNSLATYHAVRTTLLGTHFGIMGLLLLLGLVRLAYRRRDGDEQLSIRVHPFGPTLYLLIWVALMIGITVVINEQRQFLTIRNFILITPALMILIGRGLANLPTAARWFMVGVVLITNLTTVDARRDYPNWRAVVHQVATYYADDEPVVMDVWVGDFPARYYIDHQLGPTTPRISLREWRDQYQAAFLPTLLDYLQGLDAFWLIYWGDQPLDEYGHLIAEAGFRRTATLAVDHHGTPLYSYRYDQWTEDNVATFGDLFTLRRFNAPTHGFPGDTLTITLWWTAQQTPPLDYSVSVFVLDDSGTLVAQHDSPPLDGITPTSVWQPGELNYDLHRLVLPETLPPGAYRLALKVYWYGDHQPLSARAQNDTSDFITLNMLEIFAP